MRPGLGKGLGVSSVATSEAREEGWVEVSRPVLPERDVWFHRERIKLLDGWIAACQVFLDSARTDRDVETAREAWFGCVRNVLRGFSEQREPSVVLSKHALNRMMLEEFSTPFEPRSVLGSVYRILGGACATQTLLVRLRSMREESFAVLREVAPF
jgi:hypothetical protein